MTTARTSILLLALLGFLSAACDDESVDPGALGGTSSGSGGAENGSGGDAMSGTGGSISYGASTGLSPISDLPSPGAGGIPRPSGSGSSAFEVLSWAGFQGAASYSFDDTQPSQFEHWAELKETGVRMTFYANPTSNWISGYDSTLKEMLSLGHELGNHTMSHCHADLSGCAGVPPLVPVGTAEEEIDQCSSYLTNLGQASVWTIAYPYGDTTWKPLSETRFLLGRGVTGGHLKPLDVANQYNLPAVAAGAGDLTAKFSGELDAVRSERAWVIFLYHSLLPTTNNWYAGVDISTVTESIAGAKEAGDLWLDSVVKVGAYWLAEKIVTDAVATPDGDGEKRTWSLPTSFPEGQYLRVTVAGGTLTQGGEELPWDEHGYYEVALDAGEVTWTP